MVTWQVTVSSLVENVQRAMTELTAKYGIEQKVVASGMVTDAVIVRLKKPPNVEMTFELDPPAAATSASIALCNESGEEIARHEPDPSAAGPWTIEIPDRH